MKTWVFISVMCLAQALGFAQDRIPPASSEDSTPSPATRLKPASTDVPEAPLTLTEDQIKQLISKVAENDIENDKKQRDYTYIEHEVERTLNGKGKLKSTETKTYEILEIYGDQVQRLTEKNDKPLPPKDAAKEDEKIQKIIDKRKNETEKEREKRLKAEEKDREEAREWQREISDAYNFSLVGSDILGGREAWVIAAEPRPGFVPHLKYANYLPKFHGRVWIDKKDLQLAKMDVECLDTVSWGLFLARLHKGSRVMLEQTQVNDEVWLPQHLTFNIDGRLALLKGFNIEDDQTFRDYKKFRTDTKIVGMGEVQPEK
jgi:hypothetical protein